MGAIAERKRFHAYRFSRARKVEPAFFAVVNVWCFAFTFDGLTLFAQNGSFP